MRRTQLLCAIGVSLCPALFAAAQAPAAGALPAPLRTHLQAEQFALVTSLRGLPLGVRDQLQKMFGVQTLDIAEPGAAFQATDILVTPRLPIRRMVAAGCSNDHHCLVYYERGGIAHTWHAMLFQWTPDETRFEWGGTAPGGLKTIANVRKALLSGAIKGSPTGPW